MKIEITKGSDYLTLFEFFSRTLTPEGFWAIYRQAYLKGYEDAAQRIQDMAHDESFKAKLNLSQAVYELKERLSLGGEDHHG